MTDKVQKIREEVEKLMYGYNLEADIASCENAEAEKLADIKYQLCKKILDYIDNVQEEPVSEYLEKAANEYADKHGFIVPYDGSNNFYDEVDVKASKEGFIAGANWKKEKDSIPAKDLEEVISYLSKRYPEVSFAKLSRIAVYVAKWQEEKDNEEKVLTYKHGFEDCKEQMMTKSIEAVVSQVPCSNEIILYNPSSVDRYYLPQEMNKLGLNKGDKIKLIIIKED